MNMFNIHWNITLFAMSAIHPLCRKIAQMLLLPSQKQQPNLSILSPSIPSQTNEMPASPPTYRKPPPKPKPNSNPPLQALVDSLVHKYQKASPSPTLLDLLHKPDQYALLVNALYRQISLIKRRSQALEDGQITIYDRALLELSVEGCYPIQTGVVGLYLTEFLGLDRKEDVEDALGKHVALHDEFSKRGRLLTSSLRRLRY